MECGLEEYDPQSALGLSASLDLHRLRCSGKRTESYQGVQQSVHYDSSN